MQLPKVAYIASKRRKTSVGSLLISQTTKGLAPGLKPCSHLCIVLKKTLVIESTLTTGVRIMPYKQWLKENEIVYVFEKSYNGKLSQYIPELMDRLWGKDYDVAGILYFSWRMILWLLCRIPLPKVNKWEDPNKRFCVEVFGEKLAMVSPIQMVGRWKQDLSVTELKIEEFEEKN
jgi:hypothetical protein